MNETRQIAFNAAMDVVRMHGVDHEHAEDVLDMARRFQGYLEATDTQPESGADAEATAARTFQDGTSASANGETLKVGPENVTYTAPSPSANGEDEAQGSGADAHTEGADGRSADAAGTTSQGSESSKPKKERKASGKKAKPTKAKKDRKAGKAVADKASASDQSEQSVGEAINDQIPHTEPKAEEPALEQAA